MIGTLSPSLARPMALGDLFGDSAAPPDDERLLARYAADPRDESAFAALVARHSALVWAAARAGAGGHDADAEDAFQAAFVALARRAGSIRSAGTLPAWLHRVAFRAGRAARIEANRRARRERAAGRADPLDARRPEAAGDLAATVRAEVERLPAAYRVAVVLCDLDGLTYAEAADRLGCTEAALRNRLARARERLRRRLAGRPRLDLAAILGPARLAPPPGRVVAATLAALRALPAAPLAVVALARLAPSRAVALRVAAGVALFALGGLTLGSPSGRPAPTPAPATAALAGDPAPPQVTSPPLPATPVVPVPPTPDEPAEAASHLRGRVFTPEGSLVADARVFVVHHSVRFDPQDGARTDADGRYDFVVPKDLYAEFGPIPFEIVATALGWGFAWAETRLPDAEINLVLVPEGPPVTGRVHDGAGRPIAGALVEADSVTCPRTNTILAAMKAEMDDRLDRGNSTALLYELHFR